MNDSPAPAPARRRRLAVTTAALALGTALFVAGAVGLSPPDTDTAGPAGDKPASAGGPAADDRDSRISGLQQRLNRLPEDHASWAQLGLEYVQEAQRTADPQYYGKAEKALRRSLDLEPEDNHLAQLGMGALAAARHEFSDALEHARRAVQSNPHHAASYGVLADAYLQLGRYEESFEATQKMVDLLPATPSLARASYAWELRGDLDRARALMQRALDAAGHQGDATFARYHLALLALNDGDPEAALQQARTGLRAAPENPTLLEARARAQAALGHPEQAVEDYEAAIARVPRPSYVLALGELHASLGHDQRAEARYALYRDQMRLLQAAGVAADAEAVLFEVDHGDPQKAVRLAQETVSRHPFLATQDAYAWALHRAGRDSEALRRSDKALQLGTSNALYHFHRGMIHQALGNDSAARDDLKAALEIDPRFHPLHATDARAALDRIDAA